MSARRQQIAPPSDRQGTECAADSNTRWRPGDHRKGARSVTAISRSVDEAALFTTLEGVPKVGVAANLRAAATAGRRMSAIIGKMLALRRGPGRLMPNEHFYYQLRNPVLSRSDKPRFVGKLAQHPMHIACNNAHWYAAAADKLRAPRGDGRRRRCWAGTRVM
jgi:hypothetical protein